MNWYGFTTFSATVRDRLREFLRGNMVYYELSGCYDGFHFEIKCSEDELREINDFLDLIQ